MTALALLSALTVAFISALHVAWGFRIWVPIGDEVGLARAIAGFKGISAMPSALASFAVAGALAALALVALLLVRVVPQPVPDLPVILAGLVATAVFAGRGALGFTRRWAEITPEQPFRRLDRRYYSPLCLALGTVFAILTWNFAT